MTRTAAPENRGAKQKILRACVVQGGKIIEEQRLHERGPLSIGHGPRNTFSISDPELPRSHQLFALKSGAYELVFTDSMKGRISIDGGTTPVDFDNLKAQGLVRKKGDYYHLSLNDQHRGKIMMGGLTLIFQFVVPPPVPPVPQLPASAKGSIFQKIDWAFTLILVAVVAIEAPTVVWFHYAPKPEQADFDMDNMDDRFAKLIVPEMKPKEEVKKEKPKPKKDDMAEAAEEKRKKKEDLEKATPKEKAAAAKAKAVKSKKIRDKIAGKGMLALLGTRGTGGASGIIADVFSEGGGVGGDLDSAFEGISGVGLATAGGARTQRGGGSGQAASIAALKTGGGAGRKVGTAKRERTVGSVKAGGIEDLDGELDASKIARVIRRKQRAVQDCYERELKRDPGLAGKIEIEITIGENGRVEDATIIGNSTGSKAIGVCAVGRIKRWRFPKPDGGSVTFVAPFTFVAS